VAHVSDKYMPQTNLVHAEGDFFGQPFRLRPFQSELLARACAQDRDQLHDRADRLVHIERLARFDDTVNKVREFAHDCADHRLGRQK